MRYDHTGLEILSTADSLSLLGSVPVGRVVFTDQALPAVQPVNFVLHDGAVVFRTGAGSKLAAALRETIVAFQADRIDAATESGWSVTVVGPARVVTDAGELDSLRDLPLHAWVPTAPEHVVRVEAVRVTGRRIRPSAATQPAGARPKSGRGVLA